MAEPMAAPTGPPISAPTAPHTAPPAAAPNTRAVLSGCLFRIFNSLRRQGLKCPWRRAHLRTLPLKHTATAAAAGRQGRKPMPPHVGAVLMRAVTVALVEPRIWDDLTGLELVANACQLNHLLGRRLRCPIL